MLHIGGDSDNFARRWFARSRQEIYRQMLSYRIASGKEAMGKRFINDDDSDRAFGVSLGKAAPFQQENAHGVEIFRTDRVESGVRVSAQRDGTLFLDAEIVSPCAATERDR